MLPADPSPLALGECEQSPAPDSSSFPRGPSLGAIIHNYSTEQHGHCLYRLKDFDFVSCHEAYRQEISLWLHLIIKRRFKWILEHVQYNFVLASQNRSSFLWLLLSSFFCFALRVLPSWSPWQRWVMLMKLKHLKLTHGDSLWKLPWNTVAFLFFPLLKRGWHLDSLLRSRLNFLNYLTRIGISTLEQLFRRLLATARTHCSSIFTLQLGVQQKFSKYSSPAASPSPGSLLEVLTRMPHPELVEATISVLQAVVTPGGAGIQKRLL